MFDKVVVFDFCFRDNRFYDIEIFHRNRHLPVESGSPAFKGSTGMEGLLEETDDKLEPRRKCYDGCVYDEKVWENEGE